jgi:hypothetical protein
MNGWSGLTPPQLHARGAKVKTTIDKASEEMADRCDVVA